MCEQLRSLPGTEQWPSSRVHWRSAEMALAACPQTAAELKTMSPCKGTLLPLAVFLVWTLTSFLCHKLAKMAISVYVQDPKASPVFLLPVLVTLSQMLCCWGAVQMHWGSPLHLILVFSHLMATLATNSSLALTFASSTLAIKMLEPASSAVLQTLMLKSPMGWRSVVGLLLVVVGAVMYVGSPWMDQAMGLAVILALLSNVILGVRNVTVKLSQNQQADNYTFRSWSSILMFFVSTVVSLLLSYVLETSARILPPNATHFLSLALASGICHVTYSYVSMKVVLNCMSVVSHALSNIFKRVLVVLLLYVTGQRIASLWNWAGLVMCAVGMHLYQRYKSTAHGIPLKNNPQDTTEASILSSTKFLRGLLFLSTIPYIFCVVSMGVPAAERGTNAFLRHILTTDSAENHRQHLLSYLSHAYPERYTANQRSLWHRPQGGLNASILALYQVSNELDVDILKTDLRRISTFDDTTNELHSDILKMDRLLSGNASGVTDYARRLLLGVEKWRDGQALINQNVGFQPVRKSLEEARDFLKTRPLTKPFDTDGLSPYLTTTLAVIAEAQRLHLSIFRELLAGKKYAILFGFVYHENKGDPTITVAEVVLLEKLGIKTFYFDLNSCTARLTEKSMALARRYPADQVAIVMNGGGSLIGYPIANNCWKFAIQNFKMYQLIIFSESIYMRSTKSYFDWAVKLYCCNPNLTMLLRDRQSLLIAKRIFNNGTRLILAPDMAFHHGPVRRFVSPYYDVMWLYRRDGERPVYKELPSFPAGVSVDKGEWQNMPSRRGQSSLESAVNIMLHGYAILQRGRVVITERLHGHIICVLLDIPHVLLDNSDLKLSSYYNTWTRGISNCRLTSSATEAVRLAVELLETYNSSLPSALSPELIA